MEMTAHSTAAAFVTRLDLTFKKKPFNPGSSSEAEARMGWGE